MDPHLEQHDDDQPVGRVLTRREAIKLLSGAGAALIAGTGLTRFGVAQLASAASPTPSATPVPLLSCVVRPDLTEGPYFVDEQLNRSDIRAVLSDGSLKEGVPLRLAFNVSDVSDSICTPLAGAQIDIWHCDALGVYSGMADPGFDTSGQKWLRGYQVTDDGGAAEFTTIYPGWYSGRAVHIHFKIRTDPDSDQGYEFTSQLFFDEDVTDQVHAQAPYASQGTRNALNVNDSIFQSSEGLLTLDLVEDEIDGEPGYSALFGIGLDLSQPPQADNGPGGGGSPNGSRPGGRPPGGTPPAGNNS